MIRLNQEVAEILGAHTGDGTLYQTNRSIVWELRGSLKEKDYYFKNICPLLKRIFGFEINSKFRSDGHNGVWGVQTSNKKIVKMFLDYGFKPGTKTYTVSVPDYIMNSTNKIRYAFLRGLFDTDGCLYKHVRNNKRKMIGIEFGFASKNLTDSLILLFKKLKFNYSRWTSRSLRNGTSFLSYKVRIYGSNAVNRWFKEIIPTNPKHLKRYNQFK